MAAGQTLAFQGLKMISVKFLFFHLFFSFISLIPFLPCVAQTGFERIQTDILPTRYGVVGERLKMSHFTHFQISVFHSGLQWRNLTQLLSNKL